MSTNLVILCAALAIAMVGGLAWRRASGHFKGAATAAGPAGPAAAGLPEVVAATDIDAALGSRATLLQFSSAFCAPCRATRRVLGEVAAMVPGVIHVEVDAERHLDLVRRLGVMRTPTTFVLDEGGVIATRASGQPRKADVIAAIGRVTK